MDHDNDLPACAYHVGNYAPPQEPKRVPSPRDPTIGAPLVPPVARTGFTPTGPLQPISGDAWINVAPSSVPQNVAAAAWLLEHTPQAPPPVPPPAPLQ